MWIPTQITLPKAKDLEGITSVYASSFVYGLCKQKAFLNQIFIWDLFIYSLNNNFWILWSDAVYWILILIYHQIPVQRHTTLSLKQFHNAFHWDYETFFFVFFHRPNSQDTVMYSQLFIWYLLLSLVFLCVLFILGVLFLWFSFSHFLPLHERYCANKLDVICFIMLWHADLKHRSVCS